MLPAIGLEIGRRPTAFALIDGRQHAREVELEVLAAEVDADLVRLVEIEEVQLEEVGLLARQLGERLQAPVDDHTRRCVAQLGALEVGLEAEAHEGIRAAEQRGVALLAEEPRQRRQLLGHRVQFALAGSAEEALRPLAPCIHLSALEDCALSPAAFRTPDPA
ncbi:MAG: hypothetical protein JNM84_19670 [Planctomycetes bacterium]|nr:hypothetical protein [Planctomycetota bacterium]